VVTAGADNGSVVVGASADVAGASVVPRGSSALISGSAIAASVVGG